MAIPRFSEPTKKAGVPLTRLSFYIMIIFRNQKEGKIMKEFDWDKVLLIIGAIVIALAIGLGT